MTRPARPAPGSAHGTIPGRRRGAAAPARPRATAFRRERGEPAPGSRRRGRLSGGIARLQDRSHEAIASSGDGLNETRLLGIVLQHLPDLADGAVDAVVHIQVGALAPDPLGDLLPGDQLARALGEQQEDLQRDPLELDGPAGAPELVGRAVQLQLLAEADGLWDGCGSDDRRILAGAGRACVRKLRLPTDVRYCSRRQCAVGMALRSSPRRNARQCHGLHQPSGA